MSAHTIATHHYKATYEVRDQHDQLLHDAYVVQVQAATRLDAMMAAVDKALDETKGTNARCLGCSRI
jgi:radical SAM superfamily enzyme